MCLRPDLLNQQSRNRAVVLRYVPYPDIDTALLGSGCFSRIDFDYISFSSSYISILGAYIMSRNMHPGNTLLRCQQISRGFDRPKVIWAGPGFGMQLRVSEVGLWLDLAVRKSRSGLYGWFIWAEIGVCFDASIRFDVAFGSLKNLFE